MRVWLITGAVLILVIFGVSVFGFYQAIDRPLEEQREAITHLVLHEPEAKTVNAVYFYRGEQPIDVALVTQEDGEDYYWFYNDRFERIARASAAGLLDREEIENALVNQEEDIDIRDIRIGYEREEPVYEAVYTDNEEALVYHYFTAREGETMKRYRVP